ncbi:peptidoglycan DD-metalloendopeptidase family protein [Microbacterium thalli]|uniref:peptidoglycan DD-metalloendopeptidase family protein n=1 Tax=Microbacterium thalli TaxID=3027921 RepID=UPI002365D206|nr:peptidoglycan DD-metalloendopeptidase family protein [Microbacterium thalli]MDD7930366.1 peptidoglycan DD-metalloendopeptidase family protein [Microbacterium thalli]
MDGYPGPTYGGHIGADYYVDPRIGTPILAVADGTVTAVGDDGDVSRGVFVVVQHAAGVRSEYLHMQRGSPRVSVGQRVFRWTPLGLTGNTGDVRPRTVANAHLHLAIFSGPHRTGTVWNPAWLIEGAPLPTTSPTQPTPVYRFWSATYAGHFYTASAEERDAVAARWPHIWSYEGQAYTAFATQVAGTVPLYRFWSAQYNSHFYTTGADERDAVIARWPDIWSYEGVAYYVYPVDAVIANTVTVARFWSASTRHHFYTASAAERDGVMSRWPDVWQYEGDNFRVPASGVAS